jgi:YspA, cpYpsA-related SLOG family
VSGVFCIAVSGSRTILDRDIVWPLLDDLASQHLLSGEDLHFHLGDARGVDHLALQWARDREISRTIFFADRKGHNFWLESRHLVGGDLESAFLASDWDDPRDGDNAGRIRNHAMICGMNDGDDRGSSPRVDLLVAFHPEIITPGTRNAIATAKAAGIERIVHIVRGS